MIDINQFCQNCFLKTDPAAAACEHCGCSPRAIPARSVRCLPQHTILAGRYLTGRVLGEGGFGITYLALDFTTEKRVAIKEYFPVDLATRDLSRAGRGSLVIDADDSGNHFQKGLQRFEQEAEVLKKLDRLPGIVSVQEYFQENKTAYLVMPYVEGSNLRRFLSGYIEENGHPLPCHEALSLLAPVLSSLAAVHKAGIIHRDISPENLLIDSEQNVTLIDFGSARAEQISRENRSMTVIVKHGYAPEEQYRTHGAQGPWTDVYAFCATLYHLISGILPEDALERLIEDRVKPLSELPLHPAVPKALSDVIARGMQVHAKDRFQSVEELMQALEKAEARKPVSPIKPEPAKSFGPAKTDSSSAPKKDAPGRKSSRLLIGILPVALVLLVLFLQGTVIPRLKESRQEEAVTAEASYENAAEEYSEDAEEESEASEESEELSEELTEDASAYEEVLLSEEEKENEYNSAMELVRDMTDGFGIDGSALADSVISPSVLGNLSDEIYAAAVDSRDNYRYTNEQMLQAAISFGKASGYENASACSTVLWRKWAPVQNISCEDGRLAAVREDGSIASAFEDINQYILDYISSLRDIVSVELTPYNSELSALRADGTLLNSRAVTVDGWNTADWQDIVEVQSSFFGTIALKNDGTVLAYKADDPGDIGWTDVAHIAAAADYAAAIRYDGTLLLAFRDHSGVHKKTMESGVDLPVRKIGAMKGAVVLQDIDGHMNVIFTEEDSLKGIRDELEQVPSMTDIADFDAEDYSLFLLHDDGHTEIITNYGGDDVFPGASELEHAAAVSISGQTATAILADGSLAFCGKEFGTVTECDGWTGIRELSPEGVWADRIVGVRDDGTMMCAISDHKAEETIRAWTDIKAFHDSGVGLKNDGILVSTDALSDEAAAELASWSGMEDITREGLIAALSSDGTVTVCHEGAAAIYEEPFEAETWTDIAAIAATDYQIMGLRNDGTVVLTPPPEDEDLHLVASTDVADWSDVTAIISSTWPHRCFAALCSNGSMRCTDPEFQVSTVSGLTEIAFTPWVLIGRRRDGSWEAFGDMGWDFNLTDSDLDASVKQLIQSNDYKIRLHTDGSVSVESISISSREAVRSWRHLRT